MDPHKESLPQRNMIETENPCSNCVIANQVLEKVIQYLQIKYSYSHVKIRGLQHMISKITFNSNSIILTSELHNKYCQPTNFSNLLFFSLGFLINIDLALASAANSEENGKSP